MKVSPAATDSQSAGDTLVVVNRPASAPLRLASPEVAEFKDIYASHFRFAWRCLRALGVPERQLDDATQEVFLAVHGGLASFRAESAIRTWLYGIIRNVAFKQRRTLARKERTEPMVDEPAASAPSPDEEAQLAQAASFVRGFIDGLDEKKRDVFVLACLEELSIPEVASIVDVPLNTAYTRLRAVRAEFRAALERHGETT